MTRSEIIRANVRIILPQVRGMSKLKRQYTYEWFKALPFSIVLPVIKASK